MTYGVTGMKKKTVHMACLLISAAILAAAVIYSVLNITPVQRVSLNAVSGQAEPDVREESGFPQPLTGPAAER